MIIATFFVAMFYATASLVLKKNRSFGRFSKHFGIAFAIGMMVTILTLMFHIAESVPV